ncbi:phosphoglycolate phosphatase [Streptococcus sp. HMSC071D03]|uniref:HAD hydrolase-like protein n=1 Tax=Streptococcus TaxID=1301 RepID=UPI00066E6EAC|nr:MULTISPECIES: HAD hydrolase-like protein [Streptococcus]OFK01662.1 phosphoglycolate phosphatase [Streptococcus sp. HMSC071D03]
MSSISAIFFDLDGTLVDSSIGIHNGFTYTFDQLGVTSPDAKTIRGFMGPPLETSFATCLPTEQIEQAIQLYRSYYKEKGVYEAQLYPHIKDLLVELAKQFPLYITTTKNTPTAQDMTKNFGIYHFFDGIYGSSPETPHKADVIRQALQAHQLAPEQAIIIGDTKFDMLGAQETGIQKLAVTWGFGEQADLLNYQPDYIAHKPLEVLEYFQ